jgi:hypothetical protein
MLSETYTGIGTDGDGSGRGTLSRVRDTPICRHTDQLYMSFAADLYETELTTKVARRPQPKAFEGTETESRLISMALSREKGKDSSRRCRDGEGDICDCQNLSGSSSIT